MEGLKGVDTEDNEEGFDEVKIDKAAYVSLDQLSVFV